MTSRQTRKRGLENLNSKEIGQSSNPDLSAKKASPKKRVRKADNTKVKVFKGTGELYFGSDADEFEEITKNARKQRNNKVKVMEVSTEIFKGPDDPNVKTKIMTKGALLKKISGNKLVKVLFNTSEIYDGPEDPNIKTEIITENARRKRISNRKLVKVLEGKTEKCNGPDDSKIKTEVISQSRLWERKAKIKKEKELLLRQKANTTQAPDIVNLLAHDPNLLEKLNFFALPPQKPTITAEPISTTESLYIPEKINYLPELSESNSELENSNIDSTESTLSAPGFIFEILPDFESLLEKNAAIENESQLDFEGMENNEYLNLLDHSLFSPQRVDDETTVLNFEFNKPSP